jgi:type I restriction enzyme S subunit
MSALILEGYKNSPSGIIPSDWEIEEFGNFTEIEKSKYNPIGNNNVRCLELEHFEQSTGSISGWIDSEGQKSIKNKFQKGQVLFGKLRPYLRKYWFAEFDGVCSSEVWVLKSKGGKCVNKFLFYLIQSNHFIQVANVSSGSKMPRADWDYVSTFPFPLPTVVEQKAISKILENIDNAINLTTKIILQKELRKKWLMQQLLTGKKRLKGFSEKWEFEKIHKIAKEVSIKNRNDLNMIVLSCTKYDGLVPSLEYFGRKIYSDDLSTYKRVPVYHFAYATNHIEEGSIGYQSKYADALISPMYTVFKTNDSVNDDYLLKLLKSHNYIHEYQKRMEGSIDRRGGLRWDEFSKIRVPVPSLREQEAIANVINMAAKEIGLLMAKVEKLLDQKRGAMQLLLTGKKKLNIK